MRAKKGFALALTLWIVAIMSLVSVLFLSYSKKVVQKSRDLEAKLEVTIEAESTFELLKFYGATGEIVKNRIVNKNLEGIFPSFPTILPIDSRETVWDNRTIILQDTAGLINISDIDAIANFVGYESNSKDKKVIIQDSIEDWLDTDSLSHLNGAEDSFYRTLGYKYGTRDRRYFASIEELSLLRGIVDWNPLKVKKLLSQLYIFKRSTRNILTMNIDTLGRIYHFNKNDLAQLKKARDEGDSSFESLFYHLNPENFNFERDSSMASGAIKVKVIVSKRNVTKEISAMVDFIQTKRKAFEVLKYQD